jgi:hypothetical protein
MAIPIYNFPSDYDMFGSRNHNWNDYSVDYDDQTWQENTLYKRRHDNLYKSSFEREQEEIEEENC